MKVLQKIDDSLSPERNARLLSQSFLLPLDQCRIYLSELERLNLIVGVTFRSYLGSEHDATFVRSGGLFKTSALVVSLLSLHHGIPMPLVLDQAQAHNAKAKGKLYTVFAKRICFFV